MRSRRRPRSRTTPVPSWELRRPGRPSPSEAGTLDQLRATAASLGLTMGDAELAAHLECLRPSFAAYNIVDRMPDEVPAVKYPRTPGSRPSVEENRFGAWYVKTRIEGAPSGKLKGKSVKDNICLAGVPMMNGASTLEGYVPDVDATVVQRILDAGGTIVGKSVCEYFCFSGGSHTSATGPVHNPHRATVTPRAGRPPAVPHWWRPAKSQWRSAATRADRSVCPPRSAASTG
jgi:hypothetical protein